MRRLVGRGPGRRRRRVRVVPPARARRGLGQAGAQPAGHRRRAHAARRAPGRARPRHVRHHARPRLRPRRARRAVGQDGPAGHLDGAQRLPGRVPAAGQGRGPRRRGLAADRLPADRLPGHAGRARPLRPGRRVRRGAVGARRGARPVLPRSRVAGPCPGGRGQAVALRLGQGVRAGDGHPSRAGRRAVARGAAPPSAASTRSTCCATSPSTTTSPPASGSWSPTTTPTRSPGCCSDDRTLLGLSDAGAHASQLCDAVFSTYLLEHWVRDTGTLSLEKAIWRITGHPAAVFGIPGRGRVAPGYFADLVAFDPDGGRGRADGAGLRPARGCRPAHRPQPRPAPGLGQRRAGQRRARRRAAARACLIRDGGTSAGPAQLTAQAVRGAAMEIPRIISVDDHVIEPAHVWQDYLPAAFRDAGPRLVRVKGRLRFEPRHMAFRETPTGTGPTAGPTRACCSRSPAGSPRSASPRDQADNRAVLFDDMLPGCYDRTARLADMDAQPHRGVAVLPHVPALLRADVPRSAGPRPRRWPASGPTTTG